MPIKRTLMNVLLTDGTEHYNVAITGADQMQWARTARVRPELDPEDQITGGYFLVWHSLKRAELYTGTWEEFRDVVDTVEVAEDGAVVSDPEDPTQ